MAEAEREEEPGHCVPEKIPASLPCLTAGRTGEEPSPGTVSVSVLPTHYTVPLEEDTELLVELRTRESSRDRPLVGCEVRQGRL